MRKLALFVLLLLIAVPRPVRAQKSRVEIFAGYSHLRDDVSSIIQPFTACIPEATNCPPPFGSGVGLNGWQASVTENATHWVGVTEEFAGYYGTHHPTSYRFHKFSVLAGPRLTYPHLKPLTPFAHALFGYGSTKILDTINDSVTDSSFAWALGGGLDLYLGRRTGIRLFQTDYYRTKVFSRTQNDFRISFGMVFRFGSK